MGDILDFVVKVQEQKRLRDTARSEQISKGIESFITNQQNQRLMDIKEKAAEIDLAESIRKQSENKQKQELLQRALGGEGGSNNLPPGTTLNVNGFNIPLNPKLTEAEQSSVAGMNKFEPLVDIIKQRLDEGVLGKDTLKRSYNQWLAEGGGDMMRRFLIPDNTALEQLASSAAEMKKFAFSEGGKQLSPTELKVVMAGLSFFGKSDNQIKADFTAAIDILRKKKELALGGANVEKNKSDGNSSIQDLAKKVLEDRRKNARSK